jgi:hypothetical protein
MHAHEVEQKDAKRYASAPHRVVHVLQAALRVVRRRHAEVGPHLLVPDLGHVGHRERAADEAALDLVPQDDVQRVRDLCLGVVWYVFVCICLIVFK